MIEVPYTPYLHGMHPGDNFKITGKWQGFKGGIVAVWADITLGTDPVFYGDIGVSLPVQAKHTGFAWTAGLRVNDFNMKRTYDCIGILNSEKVYNIRPVDETGYVWIVPSDKLRLRMFTMYQGVGLDAN